MTGPARGFRSTAWACLAVAFVVACYDAEQTPADGGVDASSDGGLSFLDAPPLVDPFGDASLALRARALFHQGCQGGPESGCHSDSAANFTARLDPDGGDIVDVPSTEMPNMVRVEPFHPENSYLYWKVSGDPRIDGGTMPLVPGYDPRIPALIGPWIEAGAP